MMKCFAFLVVATVASASAHGDVQQRSIESDIEQLGEEAARAICTYAVGIVMNPLVYKLCRTC